MAAEPAPVVDVVPPVKVVVPAVLAILMAGLPAPVVLTVPHVTAVVPFALTTTASLPAPVVDTFPQLADAVVTPVIRIPPDVAPVVVTDPVLAKVSGPVPVITTAPPTPLVEAPLTVALIVPAPPVMRKAFAPLAVCLPPVKVTAPVELMTCRLHRLRSSDSPVVRRDIVRTGIDCQAVASRRDVADRQIDGCCRRDDGTLRARASGRDVAQIARHPRAAHQGHGDSGAVGAKTRAGAAQADRAVRRDVYRARGAGAVAHAGGGDVAVIGLHRACVGADVEAGGAGTGGVNDTGIGGDRSCAAGIGGHAVRPDPGGRRRRDVDDHVAAVGRRRTRRCCCRPSC